MSILDFTVWDVQHGNAIIAKTPNGRNIIFDLGVGSHNNKKGKEFSPLNHINNVHKVSKVDHLVISHPHGDHLDDLRNIDVSNDFFIKSINYPQGGRLSKDFIKGANQSKDSTLVDRYYKLKNNVKRREQIINGSKNFGNVKVKSFQQSDSGTSNINNYSIVSFLKFGSDTVLIPGDIEDKGWEELMENPNFKNWLRKTTILVASHHGREAGYYRHIFSYFTPKVVIISDARFGPNSQTSKYTSKVPKPIKVYKSKTDQKKERKVLSTRSNGAINLKISENDIEKVRVQKFA
jgi:competence protein ComEC